MPTDLLMELTHEAADSSRRKARHVKAFVETADGAAAESGRQWIEANTREVVATATRGGVELAGLWGSISRCVSTGTRSSLLRLWVDEAVQAFAAWSLLEAETRRLVGLAVRLGISIDEQSIRELDAAARSVAGAKADAEKLLAALDSPHPEPDAARLAEGRRDAAEGRTMKPDEVIAAIRAARK